MGGSRGPAMIANIEIGQEMIQRWEMVDAFSDLKMIV
jgi:hypothetical protein